MSSSIDPEEAKEYLVVVTTYPTTYGCNRGKSYTKQQFLRESDVDYYCPSGKNADPIPGSGFKEYKDAVACAREMLDEECSFTDHCNFYAADKQPPFDSADFKNYDSDEEVRIAIMTKTEFALMMQYQMQTMGYLDAQGNVKEIRLHPDIR
jgi:hypothetical protein